MKNTGAPLVLGILMLVLLRQAPSAAAVLTCSATPLSDGSFRYRLSEPPESALCETCWEDKNKTVIAHDLKSLPLVVKNLNNQSITLKACWDVLLYTRDCSGVVDKVECRVNCSKLPEPITVNTTQTCVFENWCPDRTEVIIITIIIFLIVVATCGSLLHFGFISKGMCPRGRGAISYSSATQEVKTELPLDVV